MMKRMLSWAAAVLVPCGFAGAAPAPFAFASDVTITPASDVMITPASLVVEYDEEEDEDAVLSPAEEDELWEPVDELYAKAHKDELELLVFTYKKRGICGPCDIARPAWKSLQAAGFPITPIYFDDKSRIMKDHKRDVFREYRITSAPTFVLIKRLPDGDAEELARWSGAGSLGSVESKCRQAFERARFEPPKKKPFKPTPPRRVPKPKPKPAPPRRFGLLA